MLPGFKKNIIMRKNPFGDTPSPSITVPSAEVTTAPNFNPALVTQINVLEHELLSIKAIQDQEDADKANAVLKKSKQLIVSINTERKMLTAPLDAAKKQIMEYESKIVGKLQNLTEAVNESVRQFLLREQKHRQEAEAKIEADKQAELMRQNALIERERALRDKLFAFESDVNHAINSATVHNISEKIDFLKRIQITGKAWAEYVHDAEMLREKLLDKMMARSAELYKAEKLAGPERERQAAEAAIRQAEEASALQEKRMAEAQAAHEAQQAAAIALQQEAEWKQAAQGKQRGTKRWVFDEETIDLALLPAEFHTFDKAKIKAAIAEGRTDIPGVKIYQDIINVSR